MNTTSYSFADFDAYVQSGQKIHAIKMLREVSGLGLKDSKDLVELYANTGDRSGIYKYFMSPQEFTRPSCQLGFEHGTVIFMPSTMEIKVEGVFNPSEWDHLNRILSAIDPAWRKNE